MSANPVAEGRFGTSRTHPMRPEGWRIVLSIVLPTVWLSFTLLYVGFWAPSFSLFQSVIVVLVSVIVLAGVLGAAWASFGLRQHFGPP